MKEENNVQLVKFSIEVDPSENPSKKLDIFQHMLTFPDFPDIIMSFLSFLDILDHF